MNISYQGWQKDISCISYLGEGHFFCGTSAGHFKFRLWEGNTNDPNSPFMQTLLRNEEWSKIWHIEVVDKNEYDPKELVVVTNMSDSLSVINLYRRGITLEIYVKYDFGTSNKTSSRSNISSLSASRISNMNSWTLGSNSYLILNSGRNSKILKVVHDKSDEFEEEKISRTPHLNDDNMDDQNDISINIPQFEFKEIYSNPWEILFSTVMKSLDSIR